MNVFTALLPSSESLFPTLMNSPFYSAFQYCAALMIMKDLHSRYVLSLHEISSARFSSLKRAFRLCLTVERVDEDLKRFKSRGDLIE
jgi:hypothetical protein